MERKIYCTNCNTYLGVIRDATLRKGIAHLCFGCECERTSITHEPIYDDRIKNYNKEGVDLNGLFGDLFGGKT